MSQARSKSPFEYTGGNAALNFADTVNNRTGAHPEDLFTDYGRLVQWAKESGVIAPRTAERLLRLAAEAPGHAQSVLRQALQLREAIYDLFVAIVHHRGIPSTALAQVNAAAQHGAAHTRIATTHRRFAWEWIQPESHLDSILWPVAQAAADLLTSEELVHVRQCASETCAWLFLDKTKNHRRRWCEMKTCGNRDKARRYYQRQKAG